MSHISTRLKNEIDTLIRAGGDHPTVVNLAGGSTRQRVWRFRQLAVHANAVAGGRLTPGSTRATIWTGERSVGREHSGRIDVSYGFGEGRGNVTLAAHYNGRARDTVFDLPGFIPHSDAETLDDYWLISAAASWKVQPGMEMFGRVENLLDETYQEVFGFNTAGIAAYGGMRITFGGEDGAALAPAVQAGRIWLDRRRGVWPGDRSRERWPWAGCRARPMACRQRIVSLNLCADQILVDLVPRERIAAVSHLAADPWSSAVAEKARGIPWTRGKAEEVLAYRSRPRYRRRVHDAGDGGAAGAAWIECAEGAVGQRHRRRCMP